MDDASTVLLYPTLSELADPSRVFVVGESASGVLARHLNSRFSGAPGALVRLRRFVVLMPFFTGAEPTFSRWNTLHFSLGATARSRLRTSRGPAGGGRTTSATAALRSRSPSMENEK